MQVKSAAPLLSRPIEMWKRAFEAIGGIGEHFGGTNVFGAPSLFGMSLGEAFPMLLTLLYAAGGDPIPVERFHRRVREAVNARMGCVVDDLAGDVEQRLWRRDVTALLDALELLGAVHLEESHADDDDAHRALVELAGRDDPDPTLVGLTPIGLWAVREMLVESGRARAARGRARRRGHRVRLRAAAPACAARSPRPSSRPGWRRAPAARGRPRGAAATCSAPRTRRTASWRSTRWPRPANGAASREGPRPRRTAHRGAGASDCPARSRGPATVISSDEAVG